MNPDSEPIQRAHQAFRLGLLGAWLLMCTASGFSLDAQAQSSDPETAPLKAMREFVRDAEGAPALVSDDLVRALLSLGPQAYDDFERVLAGPHREGDPHLKSSTRRVLEKARDGIPGYVLGRMQDPLLAGRRIELESMLALRVLADRGSASDLTRITQFMSGGAEHAERAPRVTQAATDALTGLLQRDSSTFSLLRRLYPALESSIKPLVLRALGQYPCPDSIAFLADQLDGATELKLVVLSQLGRAVQVAGAQLDDPVCSRIQIELRSLDPATQREACLALGRLEDRAALGDLIDLLGQDPAGVSSSAHWALERIAGVQIPPDADRWQVWWQHEVSWWNDEAPGLLDGLQGKSGQAAAALRKLGSHPLYRHPIAREVSRLLEDKKPSLVAQACSVLEVLRSREAIKGLEQVIARDDPATRTHAQRALKNILP